MDFAYDFQPLGGNNNNMNMNQNPQNEEILSDENNNINKNEEVEQRQRVISNSNANENRNLNEGGYNEVEKLAQETTNLIKNLRVVSKKVEIVTKVTYTFEDGSTKVVTQNQTHEFK